MKKSKSKKILCVVTTSGKKRLIPHLEHCIESLQEAASNQVEIKITVITDHMRQLPSWLADQVTVMLATSSSFGAKHNDLFKEVATLSNIDYVLLLNDDAWVEQSFFKNFVNDLPKSADVFVPLIYRAESPAKRRNKYEIDAFGMEIFQSGYAHDSRTPDEKTQWGTAACIVFSKQFIVKNLRTFGFLFNPALSFYYEDVDLGFRSFCFKPTIIKSKKLIAYHHRSKTAGQHSSFKTQQTLVNYLGYVVTSWPRAFFLKNGYKFIVVYTWLLVRIALDGEFRMIANILFAIKGNMTQWLQTRKAVQQAFTSDYDPREFLSPLSFRTRKSQRPLFF